MLMRKKEIESYILQSYKLEVGHWQVRERGKSESLAVMVALERILADCFNYNIKSGCHETEILKGGISIFKYEF